MLVIEGEITLTTPLHIASPGGKKINNEGGFVNGGVKEAKPMTTVVSMPIPLKNPIVIESAKDDIDDKIITRIDVPTINANLLRGRIRRECASLIFESLCEREETIPLEMAHVLTCLSTSGVPSGESILRYDYVQMARNHVFAGVWGGGTHMLKSAISVYGAMPIHEYLLENGYTQYGMRHNEREEASVNPGRNQLGYLGITYITDFFKKDSVLHFECPILEKVITNYKDTISDYQDKIIKERLDKKSNGGKKKDLDNMFGMENIAPGVSFTFRLEFGSHLNGEQIGLVLLAIERMKKRQGLGGVIRYGMGQFDFNYGLYEVHSDGDYELIDDETINQYKDDAGDAINNITETDLMDIYREPESKDEKKAAKKVVKEEKAAA